MVFSLAETFIENHIDEDILGPRQMLLRVAVLFFDSWRIIYYVKEERTADVIRTFQVK